MGKGRVLTISERSKVVQLLEVFVKQVRHVCWPRNSLVRDQFLNLLIVENMQLSCPESLEKGIDMFWAYTNLILHSITYYCTYY
jgi:hypothetical protein